MSFAIEKEVESVTYAIEVFGSVYVGWGLVISQHLLEYHIKTQRTGRCLVGERKI